MIKTMRDVIKETSREVEDFTENGKCSGCGACCANYLPISEKEIKEIKRYVKRHHIKEQTHRFPVMDGKMLDLSCPFRDDEKQTCLIYPVRPGICRSFICSNSKGKNKKEKVSFHRKNRVVEMRKEFYGK